jgi:S1-C subfamily serine protease
MPALLVFLLTLCCLIFGVLPASAQDLGRMIENVKNSLAKVVVEERNDSGNIVQSVGTAFIINSSETHVYLLTNCHVVSRSQKLEIVLVGGHLRGQAIKARVVGCDSLSDLAVIEFVPDWYITEGTRPPPALRFANPKNVRVGDRVLTFGFAFDLAGEPSVNSGIISALDRSVPTLEYCASRPEKERRDCHVGEFGGLIQTDATINHGNSGGPTTNDSGEVVGVSTYTTTVGGPFNVFYARSVSTAAPFAKMLMNQGKVSRFDIGALGLQTLLPVPSNRNLSFGGVRVSMLPSDSRAMKAGLREGDVITRVDPCRRIPNGLNCINLFDDYRVSDIGSLFNRLALVPTDAPISVSVFNPDPKCKNDTLGNSDCTVEMMVGREVIFYPN